MDPWVGSRVRQSSRPRGGRIGHDALRDTGQGTKSPGGMAFEPLCDHHTESRFVSRLPLAPDGLLVQGYPRLPNQVHTWPHHKSVGYVVMAACLGSFYLACTTSPGVLRPDKASLARVAAEAGGGGAGGAGDRGAGEAAEAKVEIERRYATCYPCDGVVFAKGFCATCKIPK